MYQKKLQGITEMCRLILNASENRLLMRVACSLGNCSFEGFCGHFCSRMCVPLISFRCCASSAKGRIHLVLMLDKFNKEIPAHHLLKSFLCSLKNTAFTRGIAAVSGSYFIYRMKNCEAACAIVDRKRWNVRLKEFLLGQWKGRKMDVDTVKD